MARTFSRQDLNVASTTTSLVGYVDSTVPTEAAYETNPADLAEDLNNLRSQAQNFLNRDGASMPTGNWYDNMVAPTALETGVLRGINANNVAVHALEKKRVMKCTLSTVSILVGAATNFHILTAGQLPTNTTCSVGVSTTLGTITAAHGGTFGTHSLAEIAGATAINPKNMLEIVDGTTRDPITSAGGDRIYALLQGESGLTDGGTMTLATTTRGQLSFVKIDGSGDDLIAAANADIENRTINVCWNERSRLEDLTEQDFLGGSVADVPSGTTVTRQAGYDAQGTTPVDLTTNATLDLEAAGISWVIRDDLEASLLTITEGSAGGTSSMTVGASVDVYQNSSPDVDFSSGITTNEIGTRPIDVGVTDGVIQSTAGDLKLQAATLLALQDGNYAASTYDTDFVLSDNSGEWDAFETAFGEVSLLNAITQAGSGSTRVKVQAVVTTNVSADADVSGPSNDNNLDLDLGDLSGGTFVTDHDIYVDGEIMRNGANAAANEDVYPGTSLANGQLRFEFNLRGTGSKPDVITVISHA